MVSHNPVYFSYQNYYHPPKPNIWIGPLQKTISEFKMGSVTQLAVALIQLCTTRHRTVTISMCKRVNVLCVSELKLRERDVALRGKELL